MGVFVIFVLHCLRKDSCFGFCLPPAAVAARAGGVLLPQLGLHTHEIHGLWKIVVVHHLARRRGSGVRWLQHHEVFYVRVCARQSQPAVEELGLQDGELALEERYLSFSRCT